MMHMKLDVFEVYNVGMRKPKMLRQFKKITRKWPPDFYQV